MSEPVDLGNARHVQKRNKAIKVDQAKLDEDFRWLMADERGRRIIADQLRESEALAPRVAPSADLAMFKEGRRMHGLVLIRQIGRVCPQHLSAVLLLASQTPPNHQIGDDNVGSDTE